MNSSQVRAKARMAMKRREEQIETEEMEGGELNLVPYLDIVTNIMLFLLATISAGFILGNINSALPEYSTGAGAGASDDVRPLALVVSVTDKEISLFASGLPNEDEGGLNKPFIKVPPNPPGTKTKDGQPLPYDYSLLNKAATTVVQLYYKGKFPLSLDDQKQPVCVDGQKNVKDVSDCRPQGATEVIMLCDQLVPYHVVVSVMDALRANLEENEKKEPLYSYPDSLLFPDIIFATGIQ